MSKLRAVPPSPEELADDDHATCRAVGQILDRVGDKWSVMAVGTLSKGPMRFNAMMRTIGGVSHRMLTLTLRGLERDGLVKRTVFPTVPPKVEYSLTDKGLDALREHARTPAAFTPLKSDLLLRLLVADLVGEEPTRRAVGAPRVREVPEKTRG